MSAEILVYVLQAVAIVSFFVAFGAMICAGYYWIGVQADARSGMSIEKQLFIDIFYFWNWPLDMLSDRGRSYRKKMGRWLLVAGSGGVVFAVFTMLSHQVR